MDRICNSQTQAIPILDADMIARRRGASGRGPPVRRPSRPRGRPRRYPAASRRRTRWLCC